MNMTTNNSVTLTLTPSDARVDSRLIAQHLALKHANVFESIKDRQASFAELGKVRFETGALRNSKTGQHGRFALLNEDQTYFLLTLSRNTPHVVALKLALVKAFRENRLALAAYKEGTLPSFKELQDVIQNVPGGPGKWLFSNVNKVVNAAAGVAGGTRAQCEAVRQAMLTHLQGVAARAVAGAEHGRDAYSRVKVALLPYGSLTLTPGAI